MICPYCDLDTAPLGYHESRDCHRAIKMMHPQRAASHLLGMIVALRQQANELTGRVRQLEARVEEREAMGRIKPVFEQQYDKHGNPLLAWPQEVLDECARIEATRQPEGVYTPTTTVPPDVALPSLLNPPRPVSTLVATGKVTVVPRMGGIRAAPGQRPLERPSSPVVNGEAPPMVSGVRPANVPLANPSRPRSPHVEVSLIIEPPEQETVELHAEPLRGLVSPSALLQETERYEEDFRRAREAVERAAHAETDRAIEQTARPAPAIRLLGEELRDMVFWLRGGKYVSQADVGRALANILRRHAYLGVSVPEPEQTLPM